MLKFKQQVVNPLSAIFVPRKKVSDGFFPALAQKQIAPISLMAILGLVSVSWLTTSVVAPPSAQAYTARLNVVLIREVGESFQSFLRRAEAVARAAAQRNFDRDILVTDVAVTVMGQNNGAIVPLLSLDVSRPSWRSSPDPQRWITYFPNTDTLLGFDQTAEEPGTQPGGTPQPLTTPSPSATPTPQTPTGPRVIELPGGNRRIIPASPPANTAPATAPNQPSTPASPTAPAAPANNQIPDIPGAPIQRVPLPPPPSGR
ncbi:MAG TPA: hypothetical protein V6D26_00130 [Stenomitos sp.]